MTCQEPALPKVLKGTWLQVYRQASQAIHLVVDLDPVLSEQFGGGAPARDGSLLGCREAIAMCRAVAR